MHGRLPGRARRRRDRRRRVRRVVCGGDAIRAAAERARVAAGAAPLRHRARGRRQLRPDAPRSPRSARSRVALLDDRHSCRRRRCQARRRDLRARPGTSGRFPGSRSPHRRRSRGRGRRRSSRNEVRVDADYAGTRRLGLSKKLFGWFALVGGVSAISYAGRFAGGKPPKNALFQYSTAVAEIILFAIILAVVFWIARDLPKREAFALRRPDSWGSAIALGIAVLITIAIKNAVLDPLLHGGREQGLTTSGWQSSHAAAFGLNLLAFSVVGPITEELTFRGLGFYLLEPLGQTPAIVVIGITFGLWHGLVEALPVLVVFGLGLAFLRRRTQSIYPGMLLHAFFNGAALVVAVTV